MSATYFSLESKIPFMQYASTEDCQKMVAVDLLVQAADKDKFQAKMTKCGRYLHVRSAVPDIFLDLTYQRRAEQNNTIYHENSSKAVVFDTLVEKIETKVNLNEDRFGPHQIIKMIKPCDPNVDIDYKTIYWKPQPRFAVQRQTQYGTIFAIELESKIKVKKRVQEAENLVFDSGTDGDKNQL